MPRKDIAIPAKGAVLKWARQFHGLSLRQAASELAITLDELDAIESAGGTVSPALFRKMIRVYQQTESSLLRPSPPALPPIPEDFRTVGNRPAEPTSKTLQAVREARRVQRYISELVDDDPELITHASLRTAHLRDNPEVVANDERTAFGVPLETQKRRWSPGQETFRKWRARLQERGILVLVKEMPWEDCRGFSLWENERMVPAIVVNSEDALSAAVFTIFHEYAHLLLRRSGICVEVGSGRGKGRIELWCNRFAAAFLVPERDLRRVVKENYAHLGLNDWTSWHIVRIAQSYRVSRGVMARRLRDLKISNYYALHGDELHKYNRKPKKPTRRPGARVVKPRAEVTRLNEIGYGAASVVLDAVRGELIDLGEAADILELQVERLGDLEERVESQRGRDVPV